MYRLQVSYSGGFEVRNSIVLSVCTVIVLSACAKRPGAIAPASIPANAYANMNCKTLATTLTNERNTLSVLSQSQNSAATADAVGVFLVGIPAGSVAGGDQEGEIAVSKGKIVALEAAQQNKGC